MSYMKSKIHCKDIGEGYWKVFITEDSWDTFSFIVRSEQEPTKLEVEKMWGGNRKKAERIF